MYLSIIFKIRAKLFKAICIPTVAYPDMSQSGWFFWQRGFWVPMYWFISDVDILYLRRMVHLLYQFVVRYMFFTFIPFHSNTFSKVQANSNQIWKFQRYHLILEYARRPPFVPPFVFLNHVLSLLRYLYRKCRRCECCGGYSHEHVGRTDRKISKLNHWHFIRPPRHTTLLFVRIDHSLQSVFLWGNVCQNFGSVQRYP